MLAVVEMLYQDGFKARTVRAIAGHLISGEVKNVAVINLWRPEWCANLVTPDPAPLARLWRPEWRAVIQAEFLIWGVEVNGRRSFAQTWRCRPTNPVEAREVNEHACLMHPRMRTLIAHAQG